MMMIISQAQLVQNERSGGAQDDQEARTKYANEFDRADFRYAFSSSYKKNSTRNINSPPTHTKMKERTLLINQSGKILESFGQLRRHLSINSKCSKNSKNFQKFS